MKNSVRMNNTSISPKQHMLVKTLSLGCAEWVMTRFVCASFFLTIKETVLQLFPLKGKIGTFTVWHSLLWTNNWAVPYTSSDFQYPATRTAQRYYLWGTTFLWSSKPQFVGDTAMVPRKGLEDQEDFISSAECFRWIFQLRLICNLLPRE